MRAGRVFASRQPSPFACVLACVLVCIQDGVLQQSRWRADVTDIVLPPVGSTRGAEERPWQRQPQGALQDARALQPDRYVCSCSLSHVVVPHSRGDRETCPSGAAWTAGRTRSCAACLTPRVLCAWCSVQCGQLGGIFLHCLFDPASVVCPCAGAITLSALEGRSGRDSPQTLVTCIVRADWGGWLSSKSAMYGMGQVRHMYKDNR